MSQEESQRQERLSQSFAEAIEPLLAQLAMQDRNDIDPEPQIDGYNAEDLMRMIREDTQQ